MLQQKGTKFTYFESSFAIVKENEKLNVLSDEKLYHDKNALNSTVLLSLKDSIVKNSALLQATNEKVPVRFD